MTAWAEPLPLIDRRLQWAVAASLLIHVVLMVVLNAPRYQVAASPDRPALRVWLQPADVAPAVIPDPIAAPEPTHAPIRAMAPDIAPAPAIASPQRPKRRSSTQLNLAVPQVYLRDAELPAGESEGLGAVFDPTLRAEIERARGTAQRRRAMGGRVSARDGVAADDYARDIGDGVAVKTDSGCFVQRQGQTLGNEPLWWRTKCVESRLSWWEQAQIDEADLHPTLRRR